MDSSLFAAGPFSRPYQYQPIYHDSINAKLPDSNIHPTSSHSHLTVLMYQWRLQLPPYIVQWKPRDADRSCIATVVLS
jgi:hypothetical protein